MIRPLRYFLLLMLALAGPTVLANPPTSQPLLGPDIVTLDQLEELYTPVPFEHARHAEMAEMWDGCVTCHHHNPDPATQPAMDDLPVQPLTQADSAAFPACKSCHPIAVEAADLHRPSLKGAYHRQCLNCHREWTGENQCGACHTPKNGVKLPPPTSDDIVGRMHPPIKARDEVPLKARFEPTAGSNVLFRHTEHADRFGIRCVQCHQRDSCADCHARSAPATHKVQPLKAGRTWLDTHGPCADCHKQDTCDRCHYRDDESAPPPFDHATTGQSLDEDHAGLACRACHGEWRTREQLSCGDTSCHGGKTLELPEHRPGAYPAMAVAPTTAPSLAPATQATTRPTIIRIRRGGR